MVERFNGIFLRTLKSLQELRQTPGVFVRSAGQVNVGQQQANVNASYGHVPQPGAAMS
jgi:hypothetical protein